MHVATAKKTAMRKTPIGLAAGMGASSYTNG